MDSDVIFVLSLLKSKLGRDRRKRNEKLRQLLEGMPEEWLEDVTTIVYLIQAKREKAKV